MTFCHPGLWMGFEFLGNAGICFLASRIAQSTAACGHGKPLAFCVVSLENYLGGGSS